MTVSKKPIEPTKSYGASIILRYDQLRNNHLKKNQGFVFEIQKKHKWFTDKNGIQHIGIGCIGGAIENNESPRVCVHREAKEEICCNVKIKPVIRQFNITSDYIVKPLNVDNSNETVPDDLFFYWHVATPEYYNTRISTFIGSPVGNPIPGDLPGIIIADLELIFKCFNENIVLDEAEEKGVELITNIGLSGQSILYPTGTVAVLNELYKTRDSTQPDSPCRRLFNLII